MNFNETLTKLGYKMIGWAEQLILILPNLLIAMLVVMLFWLIAGQVKKLSQRVLRSLRRTIRNGDLIESNDHFGTIHDINLRSLHLHTPQGQLVVIPNREVFQNSLIKYSTGHRRIDLAVGISYGDDLDKVREMTVAAVETIPERQKERPVELFFEEFGDSSINFVVRFWIPFRRQADYLFARSEAIRRIKAAYDQHDITIPFPIRTLDFGIVGGEKLSTSLREVGFRPSEGG